MIWEWEYIRAPDIVVTHGGSDAAVIAACSGCGATVVAVVVVEPWWWLMLVSWLSLTCSVARCCYVQSHVTCGLNCGLSSSWGMELGLELGQVWNRPHEVDFKSQTCSPQLRPQLQKFPNSEVGNLKLRPLVEALSYGSWGSSWGWVGGRVEGVGHAWNTLMGGRWLTQRWHSEVLLSGYSCPGLLMTKWVGGWVKNNQWNV